MVVDRGRVRELRRGARIAPRVLGPGRLTLLRTQAGPLAGDHDRVEVRVESGTVMIEPVAATVALPGRERTVLELDVEVADGARLVLEDAPLVVAEGADVLRRTTIRLGAAPTSAAPRASSARRKGWLSRRDFRGLATGESARARCTLEA